MGKVMKKGLHAHAREESEEERKRNREIEKEQKKEKERSNNKKNLHTVSDSCNCCALYKAFVFWLETLR